MTPAELLSYIGPHLFGEQWKSAMERALRIRDGRVDDWSKGRGQPPLGVWRDLAVLIESRRSALGAGHARVVEMMESLAPAETEKSGPTALFRDVTREELEAFVKAYPRALVQDLLRTCEPPVVTFNDFSRAPQWPESVVASYVRGEPPTQHRILAGPTEGSAAT